MHSKLKSTHIHTFCIVNTMRKIESTTVLVLAHDQPLEDALRWSISADHVVYAKDMHACAEQMKNKFLYITTVSTEAELAAVEALEASKGAGVVLAIPSNKTGLLRIRFFKRFFVSLCYKAANMYVFFRH